MAEQSQWHWKYGHVRETDDRKLMPQLEQNYIGLSYLWFITLHTEMYELKKPRRQTAGKKLAFINIFSVMTCTFKNYRSWWTKILPLTSSWNGPQRRVTSWITPYHADLNPTEFIWRGMESYIASSNTSCNVFQVQAICEENISSMIPEDWSRKCNQVKKNWGRVCCSTASPIRLSCHWGVSLTLKQWRLRRDERNRETHWFVRQQYTDLFHVAL